ncbi:MAG TPA: hypothetical protein VD993_04745 [Chitinophagaceae bacterium]|nr:hypothetical protein [Chitinophagaceae bacterium]
MDTLIKPKSIPESNPWYGDIKAGGPTLPRIVEMSEYNEQPMFIHPAEKPQAFAAADRETLYEPNYK